MKTTFRSLPPEFVKNIIALCRDAGETWLDSLPACIEMLAKRWSISVQEHFGNLSYNYVATATLDTGEPAVLKIGPPALNDVEIFSEAKFLRDRAGAGTVKLFREDRELHAILIERAQPGKYLTTIFEGRETEAVAPAIHLLHGLLSEPPQDLRDVILLDRWFDGLRRYPDTKFNAKYAAKALRIYDSLSHQPDRIYYLHGDFHHENILSATREPYLAIDPKGIVGHLGYEIAVFLNNHHWWQDEKPDIRERLALAIGQFAGAFDIDPFELRQWAFAQMVLSAWWTFDEMPDIYDNEVAMADIWDV